MRLHLILLGFFMALSPQILLIVLILTLFLAVFSFIFTVIIAIKLKKIRKNLDLFFSGKQATDLESVLLAQTKEITHLDKEIQELFEISNRIYNLTQRSVHKVGIIRFNPFKDIGGDQSFALALLDGKNSGIVISSLHTREGTRIYSKPVIKGASEKYTLTEEEKKAIGKALISNSTKN
jgi:hypothetical protein